MKSFITSAIEDHLYLKGAWSIVLGEISTLDVIQDSSSFIAICIPVNISQISGNRVAGGARSQKRVNAVRGTQGQERGARDRNRRQVRQMPRFILFACDPMRLISCYKCRITASCVLAGSMPRKLNCGFYSRINFKRFEGGLMSIENEDRRSQRSTIVEITKLKFSLRYEEID